MLEIRNVTKIYRSKTGESVKALDNVSISFPESGMVFLLGKSGSGKSTLLNVIGGLDSCDSGEFVIKGKSSKNFHGSDFDAYRNTFIGFIFQEYNILDEFSVGANIGLALELQGKKATNERINAILSEVDLSNYAKRKPNELSGGQKQRVAIARALVKEPEIIMADEPTGALDSNTGKQIFDTLKKLSENKLVIVVSHDRDFAEKYADRIIELSDGHVLSDVTKHERPSVKLSTGVDRISPNLFKIKRGYRLTEEDLRVINDYIQENDCDVILSGDTRVNGELRSAAGITENGGTTVFETTDPERDLNIKEYDGKKTGFIHSRLPLKNAVKIGSSGLKHKKFRLVMTVFLSLIAFALFGLADTMAAYRKVQAATDSLIDSNVKHASFSVGVANYYYYDGELQSRYFETQGLNNGDIKYLESKTGLDFIPVYTGSFDIWDSGFAIAENYISYVSNTVFNGKITGVTSINMDALTNSGLILMAGNLPQNKGEIVISELTYRSFKEFGFKNAEYDEEIKKEEILSPNDLIGKHITISSQNYGLKTTYKIVGVMDTGFDYDRYAIFLPSETPSEGGGISDMVLQGELESDLSYGFHALSILSQDDINELVKSMPQKQEPIGEYMSGWNSESYLKYSWTVDEENTNSTSFNRIADDSAISKLDIEWIGEAKKTLAPGEIVVPKSFLSNLIPYQMAVALPFDDFADYVESIYDIDIREKVTEGYSENYFNLANSAAYEYYSAQNIWEYNVYEDLLPFMLDFLGIEDVINNIPNTPYKKEIYYTVCDMLYNANTETESVVLYQSTITNIYSYAQVITDFYHSELANDTEFIDSMKEYWGWGDGDWNDTPADEKQRALFRYFYDSYRHEHPEYNTNNYEELNSQASIKFLELTGQSVSELLSNIKIDRMERSYELNTESLIESYTVSIVGFINENQNYDLWGLVLSNEIYDDYMEWYAQITEQFIGEDKSEHIVADHVNGVWAFAVAPMGDNRELVEKLVTLSYDERGDLKFSMRNSIMVTLDSFNSFIEIGAMIFLYVGIGFAIFSALLLMNFIATSISYKKREIGILRAVGARSSDVFKIFFSEALIIALINFILSVAAVIAATIGINGWMRNEGIRITLLNFGARQVILMLLVSVAVALISSFLPVYNIARRKPVDAIKDK